MTIDRSTLLKELHNLLTFLELHEDVPLPFELKGYDGPTFTVYVTGDADEQKAKLATIARALGTCDKFATEVSFGVTRSHGGITLRVRADREATCTAKVVGKHRVKREVLVQEAVYETRDVEEDLVEWDCPDSLLAGTKRQAAASSL
jgi:hypothetical protein